MHRDMQVQGGLSQVSAFTTVQRGDGTSLSEIQPPQLSNWLELEQKHHTSMSARDSATDFDFYDQAGVEDGVAWSGHFPLHRGGKVVFSLSTRAGFTIKLQSESCSTSSTPSTPDESHSSQSANPGWLGIRVNRKSVDLVCSRATSQSLCVLASCYDERAGFREGKLKTYWLSYDAEANVLSFGQQSPYVANQLISYALESKDAKGRNSWISGEFLEKLTHNPKRIDLQDYKGPAVVEASVFEIPLLQKRSHKVGWVTIDTEPLVLDISPRLLPSKAMLLSDLDQTDVTFECNLPQCGQLVAQRVLQPLLNLENAAEGDLSLADAIGYSLATEGCFLYNLLQDKRSRQKQQQVCLTVALAPALGSSPGQSILLEVLPPGYCGPVQCNARCYGALKVLHGDVDVSLFNNDVNQADVHAPIDEVDLAKGDAMWFSPTWYQTHSVSCASKGYSCYMVARQYAPEDEIRWPYIQCKDAQEQISEMKPKADCIFAELSREVMQELAAALVKDPHLLDIKSEQNNLQRSVSLRTEAWLEGSGLSPPENSCPHDIETGEAEKPALMIRTRFGLRNGLRSLACWSKRDYDRLPPLTPVKETDYALSIPDFDDKPSLAEEHQAGMRSILIVDPTRK